MAGLTHLEDHGNQLLQYHFRFPAQIQQVRYRTQFWLFVTGVLVKTCLCEKGESVGLLQRNLIMNIGALTVNISLRTTLMWRSCTYDRYDRTPISESIPNVFLPANTFSPYFRILNASHRLISLCRRSTNSVLPTGGTYLEMIFCGKQLPSRATTQSKCGAFCIYVLSKQLTNSSSSCG